MTDAAESRSSLQVPRRRRRRWVWVVVAAVVIPVAVKEGDVLFGENFHTVVPGELYRSAQLSGSHLERHVRAEGIRTVINLRGPNPGSPWYDDEVRACERLGVTHIDVRMSAKELPPPAEAAVLMAALHDAPRPLLVHCKNGADRSGLACAAYMIAERGVDAQTAASDQLHIWYGHMPVGPTQAMDQFFTMYESSPQASASTLLLPAWVQSDYPGLFSGLASGTNPSDAPAASGK
jgi:protein tyrosine/serine phosphatase